LLELWGLKPHPPPGPVREPFFFFPSSGGRRCLEFSFSEDVTTSPARCFGISPNLSLPCLKFSLVVPPGPRDFCQQPKTPAFPFHCRCLTSYLGSFFSRAFEVFLPMRGWPSYPFLIRLLRRSGTVVEGVTSSHSERFFTRLCVDRLPYVPFSFKRSIFVSFTASRPGPFLVSPSPLGNCATLGGQHTFIGSCFSYS